MANTLLSLGLGIRSRSCVGPLQCSSAPVRLEFVEVVKDRTNRDQFRPWTALTLGVNTCSPRRRRCITPSGRRCRRLSPSRGPLLGASFPSSRLRPARAPQPPGPPPNTWWEEPLSTRRATILRGSGLHLRPDSATRLLQSALDFRRCKDAAGYGGGAELHGHGGCTACRQA